MNFVFLKKMTLLTILGSFFYGISANQTDGVDKDKPNSMTSEQVLESLTQATSNPDLNFIIASTIAGGALGVLTSLLFNHYLAEDTPLAIKALLYGICGCSGAILGASTSMNVTLHQKLQLIIKLYKSYKKLEEKHPRLAKAAQKATQSSIAQWLINRVKIWKKGW